MSNAPLLFHVFPTFRVGGSQARFAVLANHFGPRYRHAILAMDGAYDCLQRLGPQVDAVRWDTPVAKRRTLGNALAFRRILRARCPDLLVTYNWGSIEWALANRPRIARHVHIEDGFGPEEAERQLFRRVLTRRYALPNTTVVVPSRTLRRIAVDRWHLPVKNVRYVPNGIDLARFSAAVPLPLPEGPRPIIGTVAALRAEKNIGRLLRAFRTVREKLPCRLLIAGDGPERPKLERLARELAPPESVIFCGHVEEVERVYASLDVFALSSDTEQMPTSVMEAMASALSVVSTDVGDIREMVSPKNRPFVTPCDDRLFTDALCRIVADEQARLASAATNQDLARRQFDIGRMFADYDVVFSVAQ